MAFGIPGGEKPHLIAPGSVAGGVVNPGGAMTPTPHSLPSMIPGQRRLPAPRLGAVPHVSYDPATGLPTGTPQRTINVGAYTPDYQQMLQTDPILHQQQIDLSADSTHDKANRDASISQQLIQYGGQIPGMDLPSDYTMDDTTKQAIANANASGMSTTAQLQHEHDRNLQMLQNNLAARGMLSSGETGYQVGEEGLQNKLQNAQAAQSFNNYINGVIQGFAQNEHNRQLQNTQDVNDAANREAQINPALPGQPINAAYNPVLGAYQGADGNYYGKSGDQTIGARDVRQNSRSPVLQLMQQYRTTNPKTGRSTINWTALKKTPEFQRFLQANQILGLNPSK